MLLIMFEDRSQYLNNPESLALKISSYCAMPFVYDTNSFQLNKRILTKRRDVIEEEEGKNYMLLVFISYLRDLNL